MAAKFLGFAKAGRVFAALLLGLALPLAMGMGLGGEETGNPTHIPHPVVSHKVRLVDATGLAVSLISFAIDGKAFVIGRLGAGQTAVPFDKVTKVSFANREEGLVATVQMKGGASLDLVVNQRQFATGVAGYGNYKVRLKNIKSISFLGLAGN